MCVTHSDTCTFTMFRDSSVLRIVDNGLDCEETTPRIVKRFNKQKQGEERWKRYAKVSNIPGGMLKSLRWIVQSLSTTSKLTTAGLTP